MSDRGYRTVRPTLPEGYQYGDARKCRLDKVYGATCSTCWTEMVYQPVLHAWVCKTCPARIELPWTSACFEPWRAPHENAAEQLKRRATAFDVMTPHSGAEMLDLLESQRTGDESV